ncbi:restriction endonuclease subunit S [Meridianimarinicoccus sp. RP-17]|uniref:restriction endonuclease subunit S n=1 Tax=Meridianimarinicoccus zhengii TaxID=2056810 RepID=UPI000DAD9673|nr:restriction endonuclease subunit S [Phycocomes zhengii]
MTELPSGWTTAEIGELLLGITAGKNLKCEERPPLAHERGVIKVSAVTWGTFDASQSKTFPRSFEPAPDTAIKAGDFLFSRANTLELVGAVVMVKKDHPNLFLSDKVLRLDLPTELKPWLLVYLRSLEGRRKLGAVSSGNQMSMRNIGQSSLKSVSIPIPPLNEQCRIVEKIEAMFDEIDKGVEGLQTARTTLGLYRQSLLKSAFEGRLTADWRARNADKLEARDTLIARIQKERDTRYKAALDAWQDALAEWRAAGEKVKKPAKPKRPKDFVGSAKIPSGLTVPVPEEWLTLAMSDLGQTTGGLTKNQKRNALHLKAKYLRVANVYSNRLELDEIMEIGVTEEELVKTSLVTGDLLFVEGNGSIEQIGRVAIWNGSIPKITHQNHLIRFSADGILLSRFALYFMMSPVGRKLIEAQASSTSGLHTLSISKIEGLPVPICSPAEQAEIVRRLDARLEAADGLEAEIDAAVTRAIALRQSILKKAFSGYLVPQDPDDEPAAALLDRIKAERMKSPKTTRRKALA